MVTKVLRHLSFWFSISSLLIALFTNSNSELPKPGPALKDEEDALANTDDASITTVDLEKPFETFESMMAGLKKWKHTPHGFDVTTKTKGNPWDRK
jgi:hypothetical protein